MPDGLPGSTPGKVLATIVAQQENTIIKEGRKTMKSIISNHEAPKELVLQRIDTVTSSAYLSEIVEMGCLEIMVYLMGNLKYNITYINASVLTFELENVYCFKF